MAGFKVVGDIDDKGLKKRPVSSLTAAVGDLIELTAGSTTWAACTSSSNYFTRKAIVMEPVTAASQVLSFELDGTESVVADLTNAANAAHNGDRMVLTDENAVNNTGSDATGQTAVFVQDGIVGTTQAIGRVIVGPGVDPDAT
jgi:hypothetical protein